MTGRGPLTGIRVIELAGIGPGPMAGRLLANLGAEVVRVTRPGQPVDVAWPVTMRGRREVSLNLKTALGVRTLLALIERADVLIDPFRPGVTERLGLGPDICCARNERLVFARMTGWGQDGPWAGMAGHDINYIAVTGALDAIGRHGGPPQVPLNLLGDFAGGTMFLITGILAALYERSTSGRGQVVDAAIVDGVSALSGYIHGMRATGAWLDERGANRLDTGAPFYDIYRTRDDRWMAVGAVEPKFFAELVNLLELRDLPSQFDRERWPELRRRIADRFVLRTRAEWEGVFEGTDACVTPVLTWAEALGNPQVRARGSVTLVDGVAQPGPSPRLSRSKAGLPTAPRPHGQDTESVIDEWGVRGSH